MAEEKRVLFIHNNGFESYYRVSIAEVMAAQGKGKIKDYVKGKKGQTSPEGSKKDDKKSDKK